MSTALQTVLDRFAALGWQVQDMAVVKRRRLLGGTDQRVRVVLESTDGDGLVVELARRGRFVGPQTLIPSGVRGHVFYLRPRQVWPVAENRTPPNGLIPSPVPFGRVGGTR